MLMYCGCLDHISKNGLIYLGQNTNVFVSQIIGLGL